MEHFVFHVDGSFKNGLVWLGLGTRSINTNHKPIGIGITAANRQSVLDFVNDLFDKLESPEGLHSEYTEQELKDLFALVKG